MAGHFLRWEEGEMESVGSRKVANRLGEDLDRFIRESFSLSTPSFTCTEAMIWRNDRRSFSELREIEEGARETSHAFEI